MIYQQPETQPDEREFAQLSESPLYHPPNPAGTPYYMAPEQTEASSENLGPWTDIYLLGAILYQLLTGNPPHNASDGRGAFELARTSTISPPPASLGSREIPSALMKIALKAMQNNPADRMASAEEFVRALRDYLTGSDKRRESMRLFTFVAESIAGHDIGYAGLAEGLNSLEQSLILWPENRLAEQLRQEVLFYYARLAMEHKDLMLARVQAERLNPDPNRDELLRQISEQENDQRRSSERVAAALAQAKSDRVRAENLVRFLLGDLYSALKPIGRLDVLHRITAESLRYFDSLEQTDNDTPTLHNRCRAYMNIGDVLCDQGKKNEAEIAYRKAAELAERLCSMDADRHDWVLDLADIHDRLGQVLYYTGHNDEALSEYQKGLQLRHQLSQSGTDPLRLARGIATSRHRIGVILWRQQELDQALAAQLESLDDFRELAARTPEDRDIQSAVGHNLSTLANVHRDMGNTDQAITVTREGLFIREGLAMAEPKNLSRMDDLLWTQGNLALLLLINGDLEGALAFFEKIVPAQRRLCEQDPDNVVRLNALTFPLSLTCEILFVLGRIEAAEKAILECMQVTDRLILLDPMSMHVVASYARQMVQLAQLRVAQGRWREASALSRKALDCARQAASVAPKNAMFTKVLSSALALRAHVAAQELDVETAMDLADEAAQIIEQVNLKSDEVDHLEIEAQLAILRNSPEAGGIVEELDSRRYYSPYLKKLMAEI
jgi:tetratricopeptide (TPR) repeat protein